MTRDESSPRQGEPLPIWSRFHVQKDRLETTHGLFLRTALFSLAIPQLLGAQSVILATLSASDSTPNAGDTITLTVSLESPVDDLAPGAIYDLGAGSNNGQTGGTIIGSPAILSGLRALVVRSFTILSGTTADLIV